MHQVAAYKRLKTFKKSLNFQAQKVVAVSYRRWLFTRDSNCKALTRKIWVFWIGGHIWRWSLTTGFAHGGSTVLFGH